MYSNNINRLHRNTMRILSLAIVIICILYLLPAFNVKATESNIKKETTTHDIAIVFDNSGSMYDDTDRWSQALYAIGVFASMLDYDAGDKLGIYPMGEISIGKDGSSSAERLEITKNNIKDISRIYCASTSETIVAPAYTASTYLRSSTADEKWLIVMTDGVFFFDKSTSENSEEKTADWLNKKMMEFADENIKVQYLGFGDASVLNSNVSNNFFASNVSSADLLAGELVSICNKIFQRDRVDNISNGDFNIDVSMNSIVAFAQGKGAEIKSLNSSSGKKIDVIIDEKVKAGTEGTGSKKYSAPIADVSGQVVTFGSCDAGSYKLNYTGSDVEVFYEPNVIISTKLFDKSGKEIDTSEAISPGEYRVEYGLVDGITGKDVSSSSLLIPISSTATLKNGGKETEIKSGDTVNFVSDKDTTLTVKSSFLNKYEVTNEDNDLGWKINVEPPLEKSLQVELNTNQKDNWFNLSDQENWEPIRAEITYDGSKLTDEQLKNISLTVDPSVSEQFIYTIRPIKGESAYAIQLGEDDEGNKLPISTGDYPINVRVTYSDEFGRELASSDSIKIAVKPYDKIFELLILLAILLAILFIVLGYLPFIKHYLPKSLKSKPYIKCVPNEPGEKRRDRKGSYEKSLLSTIIPYVSQKGKIKFVPPGVTGAPAMEVKAIKGRRMTITNIKAYAEKKNITFDGEYIRKDTRRFDTGASVNIKVKKGEWTYVCIPNQTK